MTKQEFVQLAITGKRPFMPQELTTAERKEWSTAVSEAQRAAYPKVAKVKPIPQAKPKYPELVAKFQKAKWMENHLMMWGSAGAMAWITKRCGNWWVENNPCPFERKRDAVAYVENMPKATYLHVYIQYQDSVDAGKTLEGVDLETYQYCKRRQVGY